MINLKLQGERAHMSWVLLFAMLTGCSSTPEDPSAYQLMKELPGEMERWAEYTERTGSTAEGAAGYAYYTTMSRIAGSGDADWGKILDDPDIPYDYKINMIFEIVEARLGKGAGWAPYYAPVVILPTSGSLESWDDVRAGLRQVIDHKE